MPAKQRNAVISGRKLQPKSKNAGTNPDDLDTLPLSDFDATIHSTITPTLTSTLATVARTTGQRSESETLTAPPSYNEAMTMPLRGRGAVPSQLVQQFFHGGGVNCLVLTKAIRPVVCLYY